MASTALNTVSLKRRKRPVLPWLLPWATIQSPLGAAIMSVGSFALAAPESPSHHLAPTPASERLHTEHWGGMESCAGRDMGFIKGIEQERAKCSWRHQAPVAHGAGWKFVSRSALQLPGSQPGLLGLSPAGGLAIR